MMMGILLHASQFYIKEPPANIPLPSDPSTSYVFDGILFFIHSFRMPLFFVLAGFFTSLLVDKRGIWGTFRNRKDRILYPLLASIVTILPLTFLFIVAFLFSAKFNTFQLLPTPEQLDLVEAEMSAAGMPMNEPSFGHLWFLYYLLYFYLTIPFCRWLMSKLQPEQPWLDQVIASPFFSIALVAVTIGTLWPFQGGQLFEGFIYVKPHLPSLLYYGSFFVLGYVIHHHRSILKTFYHGLPVAVGISIVALPIAMWATSQEFAADTVTAQIHGVAVAANAILTWSLIYLFMGLFLRYFDYDSPWILYISNSSYWVYLFHMPVVCLTAWLLLPIPLHAFIKFPIVVVFTTLVCFSSYHYLVQNSWVSSLLNGMKFNHPWPWAAAKSA